MVGLAVVCTSQIPNKTFESFLDEAERFAEEYNGTYSPYPIGLVDTMRIVTSHDLDHCIIPKERPLTSFTSSFEGDTPDDIRPWFQANSSRLDKFVEKKAFIVLDSQTVEDNSTCLLVICPNEFEPAQAMRCTFFVAFWEPTTVEYYGARWPWDGEDETWKGEFRRSKIVLTERNRDVALERGFLPIVNGVLEMNEDAEDGIDEKNIREHD